METPTTAEELPLALILFPFPHIPKIKEEISKKFTSLFTKPENSVSLQQFLTTDPQSQSVRVLIGYLPAGTDHIDLVECRRRGIAVCGAGTLYSDDVADFAVGEFHLGSKLGGKRVGILGLGSIGLEVAKRLEAFGCIISYNSRNKKLSVTFPYYSNVIDLASNSDVLIVSCEVNKETFHIINKDVMSALGKNGIIINVGRGPLVDEKELVWCLVQREIGGAGLDIFENEPDVLKELFELDNVVLSPHKAVITSESFAAHMN
ncbi:hypothetical protein MKX01_031232 [Papaver californicum]|nr:hypothetical protein MKX01_031232 [Papaver californicum]